MRLENILALTGGSLKNEPFINSFEGIAIDPKRVKRGNLFIAQNTDVIEEAVLNGAYGVIFDKPTQICDFEIAWIKVPSVQDSLLKLLRFHLIDKELSVYSCDPVTLKLAQQVLTPYNFLALSGSTETLFRELMQLVPGSFVLFSPELTDKDLFPTAQPLPDSNVGTIEIIEQTLFETSFIYDNVFYERQAVSPFFIPFLEQLLNFFKHFHLDFRLRTFKPIDHFKAVFTNKSLQERDFGVGDKVLIFEPSMPLVQSQMHYLSTNTQWAKTIYLLPESEEHNSIITEEIYYYDSPETLLQHLQTREFHFALIGGEDCSVLALLDNEVPTQLTLDFDGDLL
jgi:ferrochelatase